MKYSVRQYALALFSALEKKKETDARKIINNFLRILNQNVDLSKVDLIVKETERLDRAKRGLYKVELISPVKVSPRIKEEIEKTLDKKIDFIEKIDPAAYAGLKILVEDELLIDATAKTQIEKMFSLG